MNRAIVWWAAASLIYGTVLALIPLLRELHFLSAALTGMIAAFGAGWIASQTRFKPKPASGMRQLAQILLVVMIPVVPLLISGLFRGCLSVSGLAFWVLIPPPSAVLGFAIGRYFSFQARLPGLWTMSVLFVIAAGFLIAELLMFPQVFFHNHVWGYWPGPVYDDVVELTPAVVLFRFMTLLWGFVLWLMPFWGIRKGVRLPLMLALAALMLSYMNMGRAGIQSSETMIQQVLGESLQTGHAVIYFDRNLAADDAAWFARLHDFHIRELAEILEIDLDELEPVHTYVYRDQWQKKRLTGAGGTVYVPVWQRTGQIHIQRDAVERVLRHELVHVLAREFGMPVLRASPNIALVEGLAVAFQTERYSSADIDQIVAAQESLPGVEEMSRLMIPAGFYRMSGALSYTLAGSFTRWLIQEYGMETFKRAYASGRVHGQYPVPFEELVEGWHRHLAEVETVPEHELISERVFSAPGITEKKCVFHPDRMEAAYEQSRMLEQRAGRQAAFDKLYSVIGGRSRVPEKMYRRLGRLALELEKPDVVIALMEGKSPDDVSRSMRLLVADAFFLTGDEYGALKWLGEGNENSDLHKLRTDRETREVFLKLEYGFYAGSGAAEVEHLIPFMFRYCIRFDNPELCEAVDPGTRLPRPERYFGIYEAWVQLLMMRSETEKAALRLEELRTELNDPVADKARKSRLNELFRINEEYRLSEKKGFKY